MRAVVRLCLVLWACGVAGQGRGRVERANRARNADSPPPKISSLPPRPPSPGKIIGIFARNFDCSDCAVMRQYTVTDDCREKNKVGNRVLKKDCVVSFRENMDNLSPLAWQAWCVYNCPYDRFWQHLNTVDQNEIFLLTVNRWIQGQVVLETIPADVSCPAWQRAAEPLVPPMGEELPVCALSCDGLITRQGSTTLDMTAGACRLPAGHVSITPVQATTYKFLVVSKLGMEHVGQTVFDLEHWQQATSASGVCTQCEGHDCVRKLQLHISYMHRVFTAADLPATKQVLVFGTAEHRTALNEEQMKLQWKSWNGDDPLGHRIQREENLDSNYRLCSNGVSSACLQNKGALTGRACLFTGKCLNRADLFGPGYAYREAEPAFVVRGLAHPRVAWYSDERCEKAADASFSHVLSFSQFRSSFKLIPPMHCGGCPETHGVLDFNGDSGHMECEECHSPFVLDVAIGRHTGCPGNVVYKQKVECDEHEVSLRRSAGEELRCKACRDLNAADGYARGSHRPRITAGCMQCVRQERASNAALSGAAVSAACLGCDDCRNCSASSTFDALHATFCRPLDDMVVVAFATWTPERRLARRDQYKRDEYAPAVLDGDQFRNGLFQQQLCACNNRHSFAQFCGDYALRDQDAWMTHSDGGTRQLSLFTGQTDLAGYGIKRAGECRPCLTCPTEHFNGRCVQGREGACALCRVLASCSAVNNPYLHHDHAEGCEQTHALSDYECRECPVWAKLGQLFMLLVGCGNQNLRRWTPTARAFDGVLEVAECKFDHGGAPASSVCRHAGVALTRQRPFGNYSALMPYCPPGWFFKCADRLSTAPWDPECCAKCDVCPPEQSMNTAEYRPCSGATDYDSQSSHCVDRCENNMYEVNNTCLYCTTCKEGEL